jgi:hypothetical protein
MDREVGDPKEIKPALLNVITIEDPKYATPHTYFGIKPRYLSGEISKS